MSNLIRWEPARDFMTLREAMDHLFDDAFTRPLSIRDGWSVPAIDMYQTDEELVVKASIPGFKADNVQRSRWGFVEAARAVWTRSFITPRNGGGYGDAGPATDSGSTLERAGVGLVAPSP